ncbi:hypothetical protein PR048_021447 [Dryococelus australis]|uniref:Uncharacterized protein n=1 Tax=Dryococelus australis TaxID=614101 RepID=A0ABQ9GYA3_9NEOP|nr:hypothetical protein PR048_021447 [Dryococelus australis]
MEQRRNERARKTGDPRENPPTSSIVRHDSHLYLSHCLAVNCGEAEVWAALNIGVLRADAGEVRCAWNSAGMQGSGGGGERSPRKPADQRHCSARFPRAKTQAIPPGLEPGSPRSDPYMSTLCARSKSEIFLGNHGMSPKSAMKNTVIAHSRGTEAGGGGERRGWRQLLALLELGEVDGGHLAPQQPHQLIHAPVVALHVHQNLELGGPPRRRPRLDVQHVHAHVLRTVDIVCGYRLLTLNSVVARELYYSASSHKVVKVFHVIGLTGVVNHINRYVCEQGADGDSLLYRAPVVIYALSWADCRMHPSLLSTGSDRASLHLTMKLAKGHYSASNVRPSEEEIPEEIRVAATDKFLSQVASGVFQDTLKKIHSYISAADNMSLYTEQIWRSWQPIQVPTRISLAIELPQPWHLDSSRISSTKPKLNLLLARYLLTQYLRFFCLLRSKIIPAVAAAATPFTVDISTESDACVHRSSSVFHHRGIRLSDDSKAPEPNKISTGGFFPLLLPALGALGDLIRATSDIVSSMERGSLEQVQPAAGRED